MNQINKVIIIENDENEIPFSLNYILNLNTYMISLEKEYWFSFNYDLTNDYQSTINKIEKASINSYFIAEPSFVGYDNDFEKYLFLFSKLLEKKIKLNISIFFNNEFKQFLIDYINQDINKLKLEIIQEHLKEVLDYHNINEIILKNNECYNEKITFINLK